MLGLTLEEVGLVLIFLSVIFALLVNDAFDGLNLSPQLLLSLLLLLLALFKFCAGFLKLSTTMLGLQLLAHSEGYRAVVKGMIGADVRVDVTFDAQKQ